MIVTFPNKVLKTKSKPIEQKELGQENLLEIIDQMIECLYLNGGVGLAAPQIGLNKRIILVDETAGENKDSLKILVNPEILSRNGKFQSKEGCLSIPNIWASVERDEKILVVYQTVYGESKQLNASGFLSAVLQHEIDHLDGILFIDHLKPLAKKMTMKTYRKENTINP